MNDAASFDAIMQCNLLEVFCEALGAAIFVTDKLDQVTFASIRLLHFYPLRQTAMEPGSRARDLYGALYDAGCRFGHKGAKSSRGRDEWIAERIATAWKERVDTIEEAGPDSWVRIVSRRFSSGLGFVVLQDVSEQKKKEQLLRTEQERVKLTEEILDTLPLPVAVKDRNLHFAAVNREFCEILQLPAEQILGKSVWDVTGSDLAKRMEEADWQLLSSGEEQDGEITFNRDTPEAATFRQRAQRIGRPGNHYISMSLVKAGSADAGANTPIVRRESAKAVTATPGPATVEPIARASETILPPAASRNVLYLIGSHYAGHALTLGLGAHDVDLCLIRDEREFAAFIPAAAEAGVTIDFVLIDGDFPPAAFNIAARAGLDFRMLPPGSEDSTAFSEILRTLDERERAKVSLPSRRLQQPAVKVSPQAMVEVAPLPADTRLDVLAVEDNAVNRLALEQMLESLSFSFAIVSSGAEAISVSATRRPRVVLADLTLPDTGVDELAAALRRTDPALAIIGVMSFDNEMNRHRCAAARLDNCLAKPLSPEALDQILRAHLIADPRAVAAAARPAA